MKRKPREGSSQFQGVTAVVRRQKNGMYRRWIARAWCPLRGSVYLGTFEYTPDGERQAAEAVAAFQERE